MRLFTTVAGLRRYLNLPRFAVPRSAQPIALSDLSRWESSSGDRTTGDRTTGDPLSIGLVPTMGALHAGHLSLIQQAKPDNDLVVVSIFVNPLQFAPHEDFQDYPRTLEPDQQLCRAAGVDVIFAPSTAELYGSTPFTQVIPPASLMARLCGQFRPDHFPGVATVVTKLIGIVQPDRLYLGQKDAQQLAILRRVVVDLNLAVEVIGCPIVREANGLALSSRNRYLSEEERSQATVLYRSLRRAKRALKEGKVLREELLGILRQELSTVPQVKPQYIDLVHPDTMAPLEQIEDLGLLAIAAHVGSTRLIDNLLLRNRQPILAIDGPAGAGKSTVVRQVAHILGLIYLDTGAMYRAVTWLTLHSGIAIDDEAAIAELASQCEIVLGTEELGTTPQVWVNGHNVTQEIRSLKVTEQVSAIAAQPAVRQELMRRQQAYGRKGGVVMDGRDIGTQVFPDAELKIFLTASVAERARRRFQDIQGQTTITLAQLEQSIADRDYQDSTRKISPLRQAEDAIEIQSDALSIDEVVAKIVSLYQEKLVDLKDD